MSGIVAPDAGASGRGGVVALVEEPATHTGRRVLAQAGVGPGGRFELVADAPRPGVPLRVLAFAGPAAAGKDLLAGEPLATSDLFLPESPPPRLRLPAGTRITPDAEPDPEPEAEPDPKPNPKPGTEPGPGTGPRPEAARRPFDPLTAVRERAALRGRDREQLRAVLVEAEKARAAARKAARDRRTQLLGAHPRPGEPAGGAFVPADTDAQAVLADARAAGVAAMADATRTGVRIPADHPLVRDRKPGSTVPLAEVKEALARTRPADPLQRCLGRLLAERMVARFTAAQPAPAPAPPAAPPPGPRPDMAARIDAVLDGRGGIGARPDLADVTAGLATELPGGPADATAYHDFTTLSVAWRSTWTAVVDEEVGDAAEALYESVVQVVPPQARPVDLDEVTDLEDLVRAAGAAVEAALAAPGGTVPGEIAAWLPEAAPLWPTLADDDRLYLRLLFEVAECEQHPPPLYLARLAALVNGAGYPPDWYQPLMDAPPRPGRARELAAAFLASVDAGGQPGIGRARRLLTRLARMLAEPHRFDVFVPGSYNFGLAVTHRQRWKPLTYQAGDLVATVPLAPGERRTVTTRRTARTESGARDTRTRAGTRSTTSAATTRAESSVVENVRRATGLRATTEASTSVKNNPAFELGFGGTAEASADTARDVAATRQRIHEATRTAAQDVRDERVLEVTSARSTETAREEVTELANPNNEITVTYLLYELQRRFEVSEKLHRVEPVVLVAYQVPAPHRIDEAWLLRHEGILREVLLDPGLARALDDLRDGFTGDEVGLGLLRAQWEGHLDLVATVRDDVHVQRSLRDAARAAVAEATRAVAGRDGFVVNLVEAFVPHREQDEVQEAETAAVTTMLDWADSDLQDGRTRLETAVGALRDATEAYLGAVRAQAERRTAVDQLRLHVKDNVLHYLQAIWAREHRDQRYLRLYDLEVLWPETAEDVARVAAFDGRPRGGLAAPLRPDPGSVALRFPAPRLGAATRPLHEVADLDRLLGFRGNYAVFPLREGNAITDHMAQDLLDVEFGHADAFLDAYGLSQEDLLRLAGCVWRRPETTDEDRAAITEWLTSVLGTLRLSSQTVVLPSGSLFMEALPGSNPLLEDFKLRHRATDLRAAEAVATQAQLEALRRAARLQGGDLSDPDVDRAVTVEGPVQAVLDVDG